MELNLTDRLIFKFFIASGWDQFGDEAREHINSTVRILRKQMSLL